MALQPDASVYDRRARLKHIIQTAAASDCRTFSIGIQYMKNPNSRDCYYDHICSDRLKFLLSQNHVVQRILTDHECSAMLRAVVAEVSHELGTPLYVWSSTYNDGAGSCYVEQGPLTNKRDHAGKRIHTGIPEPGQVLKSQYLSRALKRSIAGVCRMLQASHRP